MNNSYLKNWILEAQEVPSKVEELFQLITEEELNQRPREGKWSIGELIDHIIVTNSLYFPKYEKILAGDHRNPFSSRFSYVTNFLGKSILHSVDPDNKKKLKTVRKFEPRQQKFTLNKLDEFKKHHSNLVELVKSTDEVSHRKTFITSPASPLIVYSLEYANKIILWHELRHIQQASELVETKKLKA